MFAPLLVKTGKSRLGRLRVLLNLSGDMGPGSAPIINKFVPDKLFDEELLPLSLLKHHIVPHNPDLPKRDPTKDAPQRVEGLESFGRALREQGLLPGGSPVRIRQEVKNFRHVLPSVLSLFTIPKTVHNRLRITRGTDRARDVKVRSNLTPPLIDCYSLVPNLPDEVGLLGSAISSPDLRPIEGVIRGEGATPLTLTFHGETLSTTYTFHTSQLPSHILVKVENTTHTHTSLIDGFHLKTNNICLYS
jgi:hypothetical protein